VTDAAHHRDVKPVDVPVARNLEHRDGRLRQLVVRRVGGQVEWREVNDECAAREVSEDASAGDVARRPRMAPVTGTECEEQGERQQGTSRHGGEL